MKIHQIIEGRHDHYKDPETGYTHVPKHTGAVTLIQTEGKNILVDTGARGTKDELDQALTNHDLNVSDINILILTHFHLDHCYYVSRFESAQVYGMIGEWKENEFVSLRKDIFERNNFPIAGMKLRPFPGHAEEMIGIIVEGDFELDEESYSNKTLIIAGDSINQAFVDGDEDHWPIYYDRDLFEDSAKKVMKLADIIIPGHGPVIFLES